MSASISRRANSAWCRVRAIDRASSVPTGVVNNFRGALTGYHRRPAIRSLREEATSNEAPTRNRLYDEVVREAVTLLWEAAARLGPMRSSTRLSRSTPPSEAMSPPSTLASIARRPIRPNSIASSVHFGIGSLQLSLASDTYDDALTHEAADSLLMKYSG